VIEFMGGIFGIDYVRGIKTDVLSIL